MRGWSHFTRSFVMLNVRANPMSWEKFEIHVLKNTRSIRNYWCLLSNPHAIHVRIMLISLLKWKGWKRTWFPHFRRQISLTFPWFFQYFLSIFRYFSVFYLMNLTNTKIYLTNILQLKRQRKISKKWLKFPLFQYFG